MNETQLIPSRRQTKRSKAASYVSYPTKPRNPPVPVQSTHPHPDGYLFMQARLNRKKKAKTCRLTMQNSLFLGLVPSRIRRNITHSPGIIVHLDPQLPAPARAEPRLVSNVRTMYCTMTFDSISSRVHTHPIPYPSQSNATMPHPFIATHFFWFAYAAHTHPATITTTRNPLLLCPTI